MRGLTVIVAAADAGRFYAALEMAMAAMARGTSVRVFLQSPAAALLRAPIGHDGDAARRAAGQPDLAGLVAEAAAMDIALFVCQSGMALAGMTANELPPHVRAGGLLSFLAEAGPEDQLVVY